MIIGLLAVSLLRVLKRAIFSKEMPAKTSEVMWSAKHDRNRGQQAGREREKGRTWEKVG